MRDEDKEEERRRQDRVIFVRATPKEKERILHQALASNLSLSRFLVQTALTGQRPRTQKEQKEKERLLFVFQRARLYLEQLLANTRALRLSGASQEMEKHLEETAHLLAALTELLRRQP